jgi:hypothetical protein
MLVRRGYAVVEAASPRDALLSTPCDIGLLDAAGRNEDLDATARHLLTTNCVRGVLFFDGASLEDALTAIRNLVRDVEQTLARVRDR